MAVTARFYVDEVTRRAYNPDHTHIVLKAASRGEQNKAWSEYTPSGKIEMSITNPKAAVFFADRLGKDVAITFEELGDESYAGEHSTVPIPPAS